jgi:hypothetical protein
MARALASEAAVIIELPGGIRFEFPTGTDAQWLIGLPSCHRSCRLNRTVI